MKKILHKKRFGAFSLAEALITLLIVCLITLASIPVLTKKRRTTTNQNSGRWVCYWKDNDTLDSFFVIKGQIIDGGKKISDIAPIQNALVAMAATGVLKGAGCQFIPPSNTKNYVITYIGAGGGGAKAIGREVSIDLKGDSPWTVPNTGEYNFLLAGAGGGGGGTDDGCDASDPAGNPKNSCGSMGGSAGHMYKRNVALNEGDSISVSIPGEGVCTNDGSQHWSERAGTAVLNYNNKQVWKILGAWRGGSVNYDGVNDWRGNWDDGGEHEENCGGKTCDLGIHLKTQYPIVYVYGGRPSATSLAASTPFASPVTIRGGDIRAYASLYYNDCARNITCNEWQHPMPQVSEDTLKSFGIYDRKGFYSTYGYGGNGDRKHNADCRNGGPGFGRVYYKEVASGLGGSAGEMKPSQIVSTITTGLWAIPGKGGAGETSATDAQDGGYTVVDRYPIAKGGSAAPKASYTGNYNEKKSSNIAVGAEGGIASTFHTGFTRKNYAGFAYNGDVRNSETPAAINIFPVNNRYPHAAGMGGAGGGGDATNIDGQPITGNGGTGASGVVIIEW